MLEGGAGLSILVEVNRSVMAPSWAPSFFTLEIEKAPKALPKWRELSVDEIIKAAFVDRELLKCDSVWIGPRYRVWTLRPPSMAKVALTQTAQWVQLWQQNDETALEAAALEAVEDFEARHSRHFLLPLTTRDGRNLYVVAEQSSVTLWDLRQRREWQSFTFGGAKKFSLFQAEAEITALGLASNTQFVVAGVVEEALLLQLYEEKKLLQEFSMAFKDLPWQDWKSFQEEEPLSDSADSSQNSSQSVKIRYVFWSSRSQVIAIAESPLKPETALLIDLEKNSLRILDIYGDGPPQSVRMRVDTGMDTQESLSIAPFEEVDDVELKDRLVMVMSFDKQRFPESRSPLSGLVCLWKSDRLSIISYSDYKVYDQVLVDDAAADKDRVDMHDRPLCAFILPGDGAISVLASYASMIIRWWRVSLLSSFQQACVVLSSPVTSLCPLQPDSDKTSERASERAAESTLRSSLSKLSERNINRLKDHRTSRRESKLWELMESTATILLPAVIKALGVKSVLIWFNALLKQSNST